MTRKASWLAHHQFDSRDGIAFNEDWLDTWHFLLFPEFLTFFRMDVAVSSPLAERISFFGTIHKWRLYWKKMQWGKYYW